MPEIIYNTIPEEPRHTDDMQDIITSVPSWLLRWGISLFFAILVLIFSLSALIRYPDIVNATLKVDALNPAKPVISKTSGTLDRLLIASHQTVNAGQTLAYINSGDTVTGKSAITAAESGRVSFAGVMHEGMDITANKVLFYIIPLKEDFVGEMIIPQNNMGKIKEEQDVLIKLRSYPFEEYGMIRGKIEYISDVPNNNGEFISRVDFKLASTSDMKRPVHLKQGLIADAEIITQDATILQRLGRNFFKMMGSK